VNSKRSPAPARSWDLPQRRLPDSALDRIIARQDWARLVPHLLKLSADIEPTTQRLRDLARAVLDWNGRVSNLISRNDTNRILERHVLESIEPAHWLRDSGARAWLDFGSGGGFPALPLAIVGVGERWTLIESRRNKTLFLRKAIQDLKISNADVVLDRLENRVGSSWGLAFDGFTSRATLRLAPTLELAAHFVRPGGSAFLWKGSRRDEEMGEDMKWRSLWDLEGLLGIGDGQTVVARFTRKSLGVVR
jgi:16S rRNA (guanine527-N7)-methyltransferase